ncbi:MAG: DegV family protein [Armatimonadota bacterium]
MIGKTAVVVDSAAYLPQSLIERHGLLVAPLTVVLDGREFLEGIDITADEFYARLDAAHSVSTSQPSPGSLLACYQSAAAQGAERVLSIHIGSQLSGTVHSAQLAAESSPIPVTVADTGQASFAEGLCAWEAIDALAAGATVEVAAQLVQAASAAVGNTFVVKALDLLRRGGRLNPGAEAAAAGVPVLALTETGVTVVGTATTLDEAVDAMAAQIESVAAAASGRKLRIGIGHGAAPQIASALRSRVAAMPNIGEIVDYVVGPSVGAHTGAGNAGAVFVPRPL